MHWAWESPSLALPSHPSPLPLALASHTTPVLTSDTWCGWPTSDAFRARPCRTFFRSVMLKVQSHRVHPPQQLRALIQQTEACIIYSSSSSLCSRQQFSLCILKGESWKPFLFVAPGKEKLSSNETVILYFFCLWSTAQKLLDHSLVSWM